jgi:hypothetical protein
MNHETTAVNGGTVTTAAGFPTTAPEETLVYDARAGLTPSQMVERKLRTLTKGASLPMSLLHQRTLRRAQA